MENKTTTTTAKLCKDCRFVDTRGIPLFRFPEELWRCRKLEVAKVSVLTGRLRVNEPLLINYCDRQREYNYDDLYSSHCCGPSGRWWEPKPTLMARVLQWLTSSR